MPQPEERAGRQRRPERPQSSGEHAEYDSAEQGLLVERRCDRDPDECVEEHLEHGPIDHPVVVEELARRRHRDADRYASADDRHDDSTHDEAAAHPIRSIPEVGDGEPRMPCDRDGDAEDAEVERDVPPRVENLVGDDVRVAGERQDGGDVPGVDVVAARGFAEPHRRMPHAVPLGQHPRFD